MTYAMPNAVNMSDLFLYPNTITNNMFWPGIVFTFFIVAYMAMRLGTRDGIEAFAGSSFVTMLVSLPLAALGYINPVISIVFLVFAAIGLLVEHNKQGG